MTCKTFPGQLCLSVSSRFSHNNLRITRILKCLGEMGYEDYQVHLVKFFLTETLVEETLPNVKRSALDYFLFTVRSKEKRRELVHYAWQHFRPQSSFVWGPRDKLQRFRPRSARPQLHHRPEEKQEQDTPCGDSVGQDQPPEVEQKAGDAAELQPEQSSSQLQSDEHVSEKIINSVSEAGDDEEEKEASFAQLEEKDLKSEAEEVQGTAENDCTKESKKRKLNANLADAKGDGSLKNSADIENISHNLGECAIDAEVPSSAPGSQAEENQEALKEDEPSTKELAAPEATDAAVKRRKVDKRTLRGKSVNLAINLSMGPSASAAKANPAAAANGEAGKETASEKNAAVEVPSEEGSGGGEAVAPPAASRLPRTGCSAPTKDGCKSSGDGDSAQDDQHQCNSKLLGGESELDGVGQQEKAEKAGEKGQTEDTEKKEAPESHEQSMTPSCPEENSAEVPAEDDEGSENAAEPGGEQGAAE